MSGRHPSPDARGGGGGLDVLDVDDALGRPASPAAAGGPGSSSGGAGLGLGSGGAAAPGPSAAAAVGVTPAFAPVGSATGSAAVGAARLPFGTGTFGAPIFTGASGATTGATSGTAFPGLHRAAADHLLPGPTTTGPAGPPPNTATPTLPRFPRDDGAGDDLLPGTTGGCPEFWDDLPDGVHAPCGMLRLRHPRRQGAGIGPSAAPLNVSHFEIFRVTCQRSVHPVLVALGTSNRASLLNQATVNLLDIVMSTTVSDIRAGLVMPDTPLDPGSASYAFTLRGDPATAERRDRAALAAGQIVAGFGVEFFIGQAEAKVLSATDSAFVEASTGYSAISAILRDIAKNRLSASGGPLVGSHPMFGLPVPVDPTEYADPKSPRYLAARVAELRITANFWGSLMRLLRAVVDAVRVASPPGVFLSAATHAQQAVQQAAFAAIAGGGRGGRAQHAPARGRGRHHHGRGAPGGGRTGHAAPAPPAPPAPAHHVPRAAPGGGGRYGGRFGPVTGRGRG